MKPDEVFSQRVVPGGFFIERWSVAKVPSTTIERI
jgi:hypothetical protein